MESVTIYGTSNCPKCKEINSAITKLKYKCNYISVEPGDMNFKKLIKNNVKSFPAIEANNIFYFSKPVDDLLNIIKKHQ